MRIISVALAIAAGLVVLAALTGNEVGVPWLASKAVAEPGAAQDRPVVVPVATSTPSTPARSGEQMFNDECGACHLAFPPQFLPARSWQAIMAGLDSHFGENASLDPDTAKQITDYLVANAAGPNSPVYRAIDPQDTPLRITETRLWKRIHGEIPDSVYDRPEIKSKSNCLACHGRGRGGDD